MADAHGSRSDELRALRERFVSRSIGHATSVVAEQGRGAEVWDVDGRRYLDFASGIGTLNVGHAHPRVVDAIVEQARRLTHVAFGVAMYEPYLRLAEALVEVTPGHFAKKALFANSGAEAVENAVKIARAATGRPLVVAFSNAFHGRTLLGMSLTAKEHPYKVGFGPFPGEVLRAPQPYAYRPTFPDGETVGCLRALEQLLDEHVGRVAAIILEPVQGEGGIIPAPADWLAGVAELARREGVVLIADEIQTGFGRTGRWFAAEHANVEPDLMVLAKSLAGGMPLSAVVGRAELMDAPVLGGLGGTYGGNPVACAAALAVLAVLREEDLAARARAIGARVSARLEGWRRYELVGDIRGLGAMWGLELVRDRATREPADIETGSLIRHAADLGVLLIRAGTFDNVVRLLVPLITTDAQLDEGLGLIELALGRVSPG